VLVAAKTNVILEVTTQSCPGKYVRVSRKILRKIANNKLRRPDGMATLLSGSYAYSYVHGCDLDAHVPALDALVFLCVTPHNLTPTETRQTAFRFLGKTRKAFYDQFHRDLELLLSQGHKSGEASRLSSELKSDLRRFCGYIKDEIQALQLTDGMLEDPNPDLKMSHISQEIGSVKETVRENLDLMIERDEELSLLQNRAEDVSQQALQFRNGSRRVERRLCEELHKHKCAGLFITTACLYLISAMLCGWKWDGCQM